MENQEIYEIKHTTLRSGVLDEYLAKNKQLRTTGADGKTLCVLSSLIGYPAEEIVQVTRYRGFNEWQAAQLNAPGTGFAEKEEVRLLRSISSRPKPVVPPGDRRDVYGYRRFFAGPFNFLF